MSALKEKILYSFCDFLIVISCIYQNSILVAKPQRRVFTKLYINK